MLQAIRDRAQGWIAYAIVILISVPFALWGINEYFEGGGETLAATVNGVEISERELNQAFNSRRQQLAQMLGASFDPAQFDDSLMRQNVLDNLINQRLIGQFAEDVGLFAGDTLVQNAVQKLPELQIGGEFDHALYQQALRSQGLTPSGFTRRVRGQIVLQQLSQAVQGSEFLTKAERERLMALRNQTRSGQAIIIKAADQDAGEAPDDAQIQAYYDANPKRYEQAERVKLSYLQLSLGDLADKVSISEEDVLARYEEIQSQLTEPEQRRASHILVRLDKEADADAEQAARDKLLAAKARIEAGESFADLAMELSDDPGSAARGGDLGLFGKGRMVPAFEEAAFALEVGQMSEPVRSSFGLHLIRLDEIQAARTKSFASVKDNIRATLQREEAERQFYEIAEDLQNRVFEQPDSLDDAADAAGLVVQETGWLTRTDRVGIFRTSKVASAAFGEDVLVEGNNSDLIEIDAENFIALRVLEHEPAAPKPLAAVRSEVISALAAERRAAAALSKAEAALESLRAGQSMESVAAAAGASVTVIPPSTRSASEPNAQVIASLFSLVKSNDAAPVVERVSLAAADQAVVLLRAVSTPAGDTTDDGGAVAELAERLGQHDYDALVAALRAGADIQSFLGDPDSP